MVETINFSEHEARLGQLRSELALAHATEVNSFREKISKFEEELEEAKEEVETAKAAVEAANTEVAAVKASIPVVEEAAKQAGVKEGIEQGKAQAERLFSEKQTQRDLDLFCEDLRKQGKLTEQELKGDGVKPAMSARLFAMPETVREDFKALLTARYGVASDDKPELSSFRGEQPNSVDEETEMTKEAQGLVREGKFTNFREAFVHVRANYKKIKEEGK